MKADLNRAARRLWEPVPTPVRRKPRPQLTWATLRPGQRIRAGGEVLGLPPGTEWQVVETTNQGATIQSGDAKLTLTDRQWKTQFTRVRTPRARKKGTPTS